jgi:tetratricopeptide (TPR) repeat protein
MNGRYKPPGVIVEDFVRYWVNNDWFLGFLLAAATIIAYQPTWDAGQIWDDDHHITQPQLRSVEGLGRIWTQPGATQQYYPLVHSVFWLEFKLWNHQTGGYHWVNILLHVFSALLLVKILRRLQIPGAWLAGALFALHPVEVESVAWISELKNTLSGVFYLSAALVYFEFDEKRDRKDYAVALGLFFLGLMSKTVIATLPAALLVIFWWQRGKLQWKRDVRPLVPFFVIGISAGLFTAWMERTFIAAEGSEFNFSFVERCLIAGRDIWFYLWKLVWPVDLAFIYPRWDVNQTAGWQYLFPAGALLLAGILIWRRWRGPLAALLFFVATLFPALGFFNVYPFRFSFVADHFQYLASLGPLTLLAAGIALLPKLFQKEKPFLKVIIALALLITLGVLTWLQCGMYVDATTLWRTTLRLNPNCWLADGDLGSILLDEGQVDEATSLFEKALQINPNVPKIHYELALAYGQAGQTNEAIDQFQEALKLKPDFAAAHNDLGLALAGEDKTAEALAEFQQAVRIQPNFEVARENLDVALLQLGRGGEAIPHLQKASQSHPGNITARSYLGQAFAQNGQPKEAVAEFEKVLATNPDYVAACNNLAWLLATASDSGVRDGARAVALAQHAEELAGPDHPLIMHTLAAGYAETGNYAEAITVAQQALDLAIKKKNESLAEKLRGELQLYRAGRPMHEPAAP